MSQYINIEKTGSCWLVPFVRVLPYVFALALTVSPNSASAFPNYVCVAESTPLVDPLHMVQFAQTSQPEAADGSSNTLIARAFAEQAEGNHREAVSLFEQALSASATSQRQEAIAYGALGLSQSYLGDADRARLALQTSIAISTRSNRLEDIKVRSLINKANVTLASVELDRESLSRLPAIGSVRWRSRGILRGDDVTETDTRGRISRTIPRKIRSAIADYERAAQVALASAMPGLALRALSYVTRIQFEAGDLTAAKDNATAALNLVETAIDSDEIAFASLGLADIILDLALALSDQNREQYSRQAYALLSDAIARAAALGDERLESYGWGLLGQLYFETQRTEQGLDNALEASRRALSLAERAEANDLTFVWFAQIGDIFAARSDLDQAVSNYAAAVERVNRIRLSLPQFDPISGRSIFRETVGPIYLTYADFLLTQSAATGDNRTTLNQARTLIEELKTAELEQYFRDECVVQFLGEEIKIEDASQNAAVLYPIILPDRLELLVWSASGVNRVTSRVTARQLGETSRAFAISLLDVGSTDHLAPAQLLYDWLIRPIEPLLARDDPTTIVFVPDGSLRAIPLSALHDGQRYLVEIYATALTVGLDLVAPRPIAEVNRELLIAGLSEAIGNFSELPNVRKEIADIRQLYGGVTLIDQQFKETEFADQLKQRPYTIVHMATHAQFSPELRDSFLLTAEGRITLTELEQYIGATQTDGEAIELLTLSACETAVGNDRAALGLAGVAVKAGARSVFASLWKIADASTAELVSGFYEGIGDPQLTKAEALRRAQLALLQGKGTQSEFAHPNYWAPFILIGNWQ